LRLRRRRSVYWHQDEIVRCEVIGPMHVDAEIGTAVAIDVTFDEYMIVQLLDVMQLADFVVEVLDADEVKFLNALLLHVGVDV
jgi:hypothetical protein